MRHGRKVNSLGRKAPHRKAMLSNMSASLIEHKHITTTVAKAKALRKYVEPLINRAKDDTTHSRRIVFKYLQSKEAVTELFGEVAGKIGDRPGGYTRILKTGIRFGDNADMCIIELVDFNENLLGVKESKEKPKRTRRRRKSGQIDVSTIKKKEEASVKSAEESAAAADTINETIKKTTMEENMNQDTPAEDPKEEGTPAEETSAEETSAEETPAEETSAEETPAEEAPAEETPAEEAPAEEAPAEEAPAEEAPAEDAPAEETPTDDAPADDAGSDEGGEDEASDEDKKEEN